LEKVGKLSLRSEVKEVREVIVAPCGYRSILETMLLRMDKKRADGESALLVAMILIYCYLPLLTGTPEPELLDDGRLTLLLLDDGRLELFDGRE